MIVAKIQVSGAIAHTMYKKVIPAGIIGAQVAPTPTPKVPGQLHLVQVLTPKVPIQPHLV